MSDFLWQTRFWGYRVLLLVLLAYSAYQLLARPVSGLVRARAGVSFLRWLAFPEWVPIFAMANGVVFVFSLHGVSTKGGQSLWSTLLEDPLICAQVGSLILASSLVIGGPVSGGHTVCSPSATTHWTWIYALTLGFAANSLALIDSGAQRLAGEVGPLHFLIWVAQNVGCLFFFGFMLAHMLRGPAGHAYLNSAGPSILWLAVIALAVASYFDLTTPIDA